MTTPLQILDLVPAASLVCKTCGAPITVAEFIPAALRAFGAICDQCADKAGQAASAAAVANGRLVRAANWRKLCPADFLHLDPQRLPNSSKLQSVLDWQFGIRGLVLHGPTGRGKSRCAWKLVEREFKAGRGIKVIRHDIGFTYAAKFGESVEQASRWIESLSIADLLLVDDVFKGKLTDSLESAIFTVISTRAENGKPIIITCNDVGDTLAARMSQDRGPALVRRIRDHCQAIHFA